MLRIPYKHIEIYCTSEKPVGPYFPEALFRGALGNNLKSLVCLQKGDECETCFLRTSCAFALMFVTDAACTTGFNGITTLPHPYRVVVERNESSNRLCIHLYLYSLLFEALNFIVFAFFRMGEQGIGRDKLRFSVDDVLDGCTGSVLYDKQHNKMETGAVKELLVRYDNDSVVSSCRVKYLSPVKIKQKDHFLQSLDFFTLIKYGLIRLTLLADIYGTNRKTLDIQHIFEQAKAVKTDSEDFHIEQKKRFSKRQGHDHIIRGFTGYSVFTGKFESFLSILNALEVTGLGKNTTFGAGRIEVIKAI